jgi:hypothetical protein
MTDTKKIPLTISFFSLMTYAIFTTHHFFISVITFYFLWLAFSLFTDRIYEFKKIYYKILDIDIGPLYPLMLTGLVLLSVTIINVLLSFYYSWWLKFLVYPILIFGLIANLIEAIFIKFGVYNYSSCFENSTLNCISINGHRKSIWGAPYVVVFAWGCIKGLIVINIYYLLTSTWIELGSKQIWPDEATYNYFIILLLITVFVISILKAVDISRQNNTYKHMFEKKKVHLFIPVSYVFIMITLTVIVSLISKPDMPNLQLAHEWSDTTRIFFNSVTDAAPAWLFWTFDNMGTGLIPNFKYLYLIHTIILMTGFFLIFRAGFKHINWVVYIRAYFPLYIFYWFFAWYLGLRGAWVYNNPTNLGFYFFSECFENLVWYYPLGFFNAFLLNNWLTKFNRPPWQKWAVYIGIPIGTFLYEYSCVIIFKMWNFMPNMIWLRFFEYFTIEDWLFYTLFCWISVSVIRYNDRKLEILANQTI